MSNDKRSDNCDQQWKTRYARQIALANWGESGQKGLLNKRVLIIGLGGLGSPVATYLASAGVGHIILNDFDQVDLSNLARQPLHTTEDINKAKVFSARETLTKINPTVNYHMVDKRLNLGQLIELMTGVDCVVDCSDNFGTRFTVNEAAVHSSTPLITAAAIRQEGQVIVFRHDRKLSPCYRCLYKGSDEKLEDCQGQGVMTPLVGVIGSFAATATLNYLVFKREEMGRLHCFDASTLTWQSLKLNKDPQCPVCRSSNDNNP